jgi:hypothetical protein
MIVKVESYFEVTPHKGAQLNLELIKEVLRSELESDLIIHDLKNNHDSIQKIEQIPASVAFEKLKTSLSKK